MIWQLSFNFGRLTEELAAYKKTNSLQNKDLSAKIVPAKPFGNEIDSYLHKFMSKFNLN